LQQVFYAAGWQWMISSAAKLVYRICFLRLEWAGSIPSPVDRAAAFSAGSTYDGGFGEEAGFWRMI